MNKPYSNIHIDMVSDRPADVAIREIEARFQSFDQTPLADAEEYRETYDRLIALTEPRNITLGMAKGAFLDMVRRKEGKVSKIAAEGFLETTKFEVQLPTDRALRPEDVKPIESQYQVRFEIAKATPV